MCPVETIAQEWLQSLGWKFSYPDQSLCQQTQDVWILLGGTSGGSVQVVEVPDHNHQQGGPELG